MPRKLPEPPTVTDEELERTLTAFTRQMYREVFEVADRVALVAEAFMRFSPVGIYCKHVRETRGEDLKSAAKAIKVPQYLLKQFEEGDAMDLELSLVARYTSYLDLDEWFEVWVRSNRRLVALLMQPPQMRAALRRADLDHLVAMMTNAENSAKRAPRREEAPARAGRTAPVIEAPRGTGQALQLRVTLVGIHPPIWRRLLLSAELTLHQVHLTLQLAMGWKGAHLYQIELSGLVYSDPSTFDGAPENMRDSRKIRLRDIGLPEGASFEYLYDFGDGWRHQLVVERVGAAAKARRLPVCLAGERACPPEDSGGPAGYDEILAAIRDPGHPEHGDIQDWMPRGFDPEAFSVAEVNERLLRSGGGNRRRTSLEVN